MSTPSPAMQKKRNLTNLVASEGNDLTPIDRREKQIGRDNLFITMWLVDSCYKKTGEVLLKYYEVFLNTVFLFTA